MATESRIKILHEKHPDWERLEIKGKWETWEVSHCHDGDVEISCEGSDGSACLFLTQEELKQFIAFLQSKVK